MLTQKAFWGETSPQAPCAEDTAAGSEEEEEPEELSAVTLQGALGSPVPTDCYSACLGPRQVHQGKWHGAFVTLFLMAGHFLSLSNIAGMGSERKTEPFFLFSFL